MSSSKMHAVIKIMFGKDSFIFSDGLIHFSFPGKSIATINPPV